MSRKPGAVQEPATCAQTYRTGRAPGCGWDRWQRNQTHRATFRDPEQGRSLGACGVHDSSDVIHSLLDEIRSGGPPIRKENGSGEPLSYHVINRVVTRWTRRHLAVRLTPHKPRHAYGKHCLDQGVDIRIIAEAVGHEPLESTKIYTQVSFERTRRIAKLFSLPGT